MRCARGEVCYPWLSCCYSHRCRRFTRTVTTMCSLCAAIGSACFVLSILHRIVSNSHCCAACVAASASKWSKLYFRCYYMHEIAWLLAAARDTRLECVLCCVHRHSVWIWRYFPRQFQILNGSRFSSEFRSDSKCKDSVFSDLISAYHRKKAMIMHFTRK